MPVPDATGALVSRPVSTQETFGRVLTSLANMPAVAERMVTTSPDVSVSTNLGGWINKMGVFAPQDRPDYLGVDRLLRWQQSAAGHHVELGISEMNLFLALHAFGLAHELHGEHLLPIGTVYDPFICRGLDALIYALYNGARFVVAGTPAGVTLAPEGGAHQSSITPSIGLELPGLTYAEPAFADALDWLLCDGFAAARPSRRGVAVPAPVDAGGRPGPVPRGEGSARGRTAPGRRAGRRLPAGRALGARRARDRGIRPGRDRGRRPARHCWRPRGSGPS